MKIQLIDLGHLPKTSPIDATPIYNNPIKLIRRFFLRRLELCLNFLELDHGNILDVGCGSGILLPTLSKFKGMVVGLDIHKNLHRVQNYLQRNGFKNINLIQADSQKLPFKKAVFKNIVAISLLDHLQKPYALINELNQVIIANGIIIFGIHADNFISSITGFLWTLIFIASYLLFFQNFKEIFTYLFKPNTWRHLYPDSLLTRIIAEKLQIKEIVYLQAILPVFIALKTVKKIL